jgi:hypothetical protein
MVTAAVLGVGRPAHALEAAPAATASRSSSPGGANRTEREGAPDDHPRKTETSGLGVSIGIGSQYVLLGGQLSYYLQVPHSLFRVVPYAGVGEGVGGAPRDKRWITGTTAGLLGSWGQKHRAVVNVAYGSIAGAYTSANGQTRELRNAWGPSLAVGYEYMAFSGFFLRADFGAGVIVAAPSWSRTGDVGPVGTFIGLGWKLW